MTIYQTKTADAASLTEIQAETSSIDLDLVQSEGLQLKVEIQGEGEQARKLADTIDLELRTDGEMAIISVREKRHVIVFAFGGWSNQVKAVIHLPARRFDRVAVSGKSADITARQILAGDLLLTSASGDVMAENCEAKNALTLRTASGDLRASGILSGDALTAQASSGDVFLHHLSTKTLEAGTHSGDLTVSDFRGSLKAATSSGDIDLRNDRLAGDLSLKSSSGDITVSFHEAPDAFSVRYRGSSGDGKVRISGLVYEENSDHRIVGMKGSGGYQIDARTSSGDFVLE